MLLEGNSNVCYPAYTDGIGVQLRQRVILKNVVPHVHRCVAELRVDSRSASRILGASATSITAERGQTELALIRSASKTSPPYAVIIPVTRYSVDE